MIGFSIAWNVALWTLALSGALGPHLSHQCKYDPQTRVSYCLPKDGCWISDYNHAVTCYRETKLVLGVRK